jgi:hypothetical protein
VPVKFTGPGDHRERHTQRYRLPLVRHPVGFCYPIIIVLHKMSSVVLLVSTRA